jgi:hypothetical protein
MHNKIFPGYQPCQLVKRRKNQRFKDHLCPRPQDAEHPGSPRTFYYRSSPWKLQIIHVCLWLTKEIGKSVTYKGNNFQLYGVISIVSLIPQQYTLICNNETQWQWHMQNWWEHSRKISVGPTWLHSLWMQWAMVENQHSSDRTLQWSG